MIRLERGYSEHSHDFSRNIIDQQYLYYKIWTLVAWYVLSVLDLLVVARESGKLY